MLLLHFTGMQLKR